KINNLPPYKSAEEGIANFPETVTALGVKLGANGLILTAPHGIEDVIQMRVRPVPRFEASNELKAVYTKRMESKNWKVNWPIVTV
ncbi:MAG: nucleotidyltransferase family protein, partial [Psychrobacillus sp.]